MVDPVELPPSEWDFASFEWPEQDAIVAGGDLEPATIVAAYRAGAFPMPYEGELVWWSPLRRGVLEPGGLHVSRSLRRSLGSFTITVDKDFEAVIDHCADPDRPGSWIDQEIRDAYVRLHRLGWAHSIETRDHDGRLVGGLYGLSIGGLFAGESMFHLVTDASKAALVGLRDLMTPCPEWLVDTQWATPHLRTLGITEIDRFEYRSRIRALNRQSGPIFE